MPKQRARPTALAAARKPKRATDEPIFGDDDYIPPNKRPPKKVTWGYVRRLYLDKSFGDSE